MPCTEITRLVPSVRNNTRSFTIVVPAGGGANGSSFFCSGDMAASMPNHIQIQKADSFSAAPMAYDDRHFIPISYDYIFHSRRSSMTYFRPEIRRKSAHGLTSWALGGTGGEIWDPKKADSFCAAPMSAKLVIFLEFRIPCQEFWTYQYMACVDYTWIMHSKYDLA